MKPSISAFPDPTSNQEAVTKAFADNSYGPAQGDFLHARLGADQVSTFPAETVVLFATEYKKRGTLSVNGSGRFAGLKAGRTYLLMAEFQMLSSARQPFKWYDITAAATLGAGGTATSAAFGSGAAYRPTAWEIFSPTVDTELEVRSAALPSPAGSITLQSGIGSGWGDHTTSAMIIEIGSRTTQQISSPMELIESIELTAPAQSVNFANLNGDADELYVIEFDVVGNSIGHETYIKPNGAILGAAKGETQRYYIDNAVNNAVLAGVDKWVISSNGIVSAVEREVGTIKINARTGGHRAMRVDSVTTISATRVIGNRFTGVWTDTSTNITSLLLEATLANSFGAGSIFSLYRMGRKSLPGLRYPPGHFDGLQTAWVSVTSASIAAGTCRDSTDSANIVVPSLLTADITVSGPTANGRDSATAEAASTWYALYAIDGPTVAPASLLSTSFTAPTLPAGYTVFRRVGAVYNDSGSNILEFSQHGNGRDREIRWEGTHYFLNAGNSTTWLPITVIFIPPTCTIFDGMFDFNPAAAGNDLRIRRTGDTANSPFYGPSGAGYDFGPFRIFTNDSQQMDYLVTSASDAAYVAVQAYTDKL
jgi:hypothetical protein